jgi:hypothetical protein
VRIKSLIAILAAACDVRFGSEAEFYQPLGVNLRLPALVSQSPRTPDCAGVVAGVLHAVHHRHLGEIEGADAFQTRNVDTVLMRIRAALVMCVDTALRAKEMLGFAGIETIAGQFVLAPDDAQTVQGGGHGDRATHPAIGAGASPNGVESITELNLELDRAAMTLTVHIRLSFQTDDGILRDQAAIEP